MAAGYVIGKYVKCCYSLKTSYQMFKYLSMPNYPIALTHIKVFIVLKHPSIVPSFDDLSNFVNAVTVNVVTQCVVTTLTNMTFSFTCWKHER